MANGLFGSGPQSNILQTVQGSYTAMLNAEKQKGLAMREAMGAFGQAIDPKTIGMNKFKKQFAQADWSKPETFFEASKFISEFDPAGAMSMAQNGMQLQAQLAPKAPEPQTTQATGSQINDRFGSQLEDDALFNVSPEGKISPVVSGKGKTTVSITQGTQIGTIPKDHELIIDKETGSLRMEVIEGSPTAKKEEALAASKGKLDKTKATTTNVVNDSFSDLSSLLDDDSVFTPVTGVLGALSSFIPASARKDAEAKIATIQANIGFDKLQAMRDASPTGGALGQVSEKEIAFLQATLGSLDLSQSREQLRDSIQKVQKAYNELVHGPTDGSSFSSDVLGIL
jgi:hypothetical protein